MIVARSPFVEQVNVLARARRSTAVLPPTPPSFHISAGRILGPGAWYQERSVGLLGSLAGGKRGVSGSGNGKEVVAADLMGVTAEVCV